MIRRIARYTGLSLAFLLLLSTLSVLAGSLLPANRDWRAPADGGVRIFIATNGVHTGFVLPAKDWKDLIRPEHLPPPYRAGEWLLLGWGERNFYLNTPRWRDIDPIRTLGALAGSDNTLLHVDHLARVTPGPDMRPLTLTIVQYRALTNALRDRFARDGRGNVIPLPGYGPTDIFYEANGPRYSAFVTCNEWTGAHLRAIGVKIGRWTPLSWSVMRWM